MALLNYRYSRNIRYSSPCLRYLLIVPRGTPQNKVNIMHTTDTNAAPFTATHVYSVPSLGIHYLIQFSGKGEPVKARIQDQSGFTSEWLPVVPASNDTPAEMVIDPNGYAIPVSGCEELPSPQGIENKLFSFRHKDADKPEFSGVTSSAHNVPGWIAAVQRLKLLCPDNWQDFAPQGINSRFPVVVEDSVYKLHNGTFWPVEMPDDVILILSPHVNNPEQRFIFDFGDIETGRSWNETFETTGYVGRSTGRVKIPLIVYNKRSLGGGALSGDIVRVLTSKKAVIYEHPKYHSLIWPKWRLTVKHDNGKINFTTAAPDETSARESICAAEHCPDSAIVKVKRLS